jgi:type II secretory pathway pseudopilin PulG
MFYIVPCIGDQLMSICSGKHRFGFPTLHRDSPIIKTDPQPSRTLETRALSSGFSLVEIIVAAMVISIAFISVVALIRNSQEWIELDRHMRSARAIISRTLENHRFQPENYINLVSGTTTQTVILDPKANIQGTFTITVSPEQPTVNAVAIPHREITAIITWVENGDPVSDIKTVRITKWLTCLQH